MSQKKYKHSNKTFIMVSPHLPKSNSNCFMRLGLAYSGGLETNENEGSIIIIEKIRNDSSTFIGRFDITANTVIKTEPNKEDVTKVYWHTVRQSIKLGYMSESYQLVISGVLFNNPKGNKSQSVGLTSVTFEDCALMKLPHECTLFTDSSCAGWQQTDRFDGR